MGKASKQSKKSDTKSIERLVQKCVAHIVDTASGLSSSDYVKMLEEIREEVDIRIVCARDDAKNED